VIGGPAVAGCARAAERDARPLNVLIVLADDLGWGDLSCYGRTDYRTPALDGLADEGTRLGTSLVGKWHLGYLPRFSPLQRLRRVLRDHQRRRRLLHAPGDYPFDGEDLLPVLRGVRPPGPRTLHWRHRRPDAPPVQEAMREGRLEYLQRDDREYLFDLEQDEGERADLAPARPADVVRMRARHDAWFAAMIS